MLAPTKPKIDSTKLKELVIDFSIKLALNQATRSFVYSPALLYTQMLMIRAGSYANTSRQIDTAMDLSFNQLDHTTYKYLFNGMLNRTHKSFSYAQALFFDQDMVPAFNPWYTFCDQLENIYKSPPRIVPFKPPVGDPTLLDIVNEWASYQTGKALVEPFKSMETSASMLALSAFSFYRLWPYEWSTGYNFRFRDNEGKIMQVPNMTTVCNLEYHESSTYQLVRLPFTGCAMYMQLIVPKNGVSVKSVLSSTNIASIMSTPRFPSEAVRVTMPRFNLKSSVHFRGPLKEMGVVDLFSRKDCDLTRIAIDNSATDVHFAPHPDLVLGNLKQFGYLNIGPEGILKMGYPMHNRIKSTIVADRPYIIQIMDTNNGLCYVFSVVSRFNKGE